MHLPSRPLVFPSFPHLHPSRLIATTPRLSKSTALPPRPTLPDADLHHSYLKGSGPGGQKINKTNSAVQLTHLPTGLVVKSQATRSRSQNHKIAKSILAEKIELLEKGAESRVAKKIEVKVKRKGSRMKKSRRKYRALEEGKETDEGRGPEGKEDFFKRTIREADGAGQKEIEQDMISGQAEKAREPG